MNAYEEDLALTRRAPHPGIAAVLSVLLPGLGQVYTGRLIAQVMTPYGGTPPDAIDLSRLHLRRIRNAASSALQRSGLDDTTNAHLMETVARIDRALDAQRMTGF